MSEPGRVDVPAELGRGLALPTGEILLVPADLDRAIGAAIEAGRAAATVEAWRTAFAEGLVRALHEAGLILVARARQASRESVNADLYSLALSAKYAADRHVAAIGKVMGPLPEIGSFAHHAQALVDVLTGHAPPTRAPALVAAFDERVRTLRELALGIPADTPLADTEPDPAPDIGEIACPIR